MHDITDPPFPGPISRRRFLRTAGAASLAGCGWLGSLDAVAAELPSAGEFETLVATAAGGIDLYIEHRDLLVGGTPGRAITINGSIPGPVIRMQEGREALIRVHNRLPESTSLHWHGILLPFNMDGVPGISYPGIAPGETFTYRIPVRQNGTYWYHSHTGLQEQLGHYGQLILEPAEPDPVDFDVEHTVVLSDWTFEHPHRVLWKLKTMEGYFNFQRPTLANLADQARATGTSIGEVIGKRLAWDRMRMDPTDIADITGATYSYLMNGRTASENPIFLASPGQRVRFRIVNASTMTFYDVRLPGLPMTVVQADGQSVMFVAVEGSVAGLLGVADPIKESTAEAIRQLQDDGIELVMLTGDSRTTAEAVARKLGIDRVVAEVLPDQKADAVRKFQSEGRTVAMAGDGINGCPGSRSGSGRHRHGHRNRRGHGIGRRDPRQRRPARHRPRPQAEPRHHAQHQTEPLFRVRLQLAWRADRRRGAVSVLRCAPVADDRGRGDEP